MHIFFGFEQWFHRLRFKSVKLWLFDHFGLSEKHTKFEKSLPHGFDKSVDLLGKHQNHEEDFFQIMCASQKALTLLKLG